MTDTITHEELEELVDNLDSDGLIHDVRPAYSGRGMYGKTCVGFVTDEPSRLLIALGRYTADDGDRWDYPRTDSMGLSTIVYCPGISVWNEDEDEPS